MGRPLSVNVLVVDEKQNPVVLEKGQDVPKWAAGQVGEHCFTVEEPVVEPEPDGKTASK